MRAPSFLERAQGAPVPSMLYPYLDHLENQLVAGCDNAMVFWREVRERAFPGSARHVRS